MTTDLFSINKPRGKEIYDRSFAIIQQVREELAELDKELMDLPEGAQWSGQKATEFMSAYGEQRNKITNSFPDALTEIAEALNAKLKEYVAVDG